ncbi:MAG TPA: IPTL-CTERM sorting domain-containing protein [Thermoanaerobaculia bacterium]|nr:IPTL-CTERM sorting domain-containing protein [Thermoanaerobaculia bacterium]
MVKRLVFVLLLFIALPTFAASADLAVTGSDAPDPVRPGDTITYTFQVANNGPDAATNAQVNIGSFVGSLQYVSSSAPAGWTCQFIGNPVICSNPSFAAGGNATITVVTQANYASSLPDQTASVTASVMSNVTDPVSNNDSVTVTTTVDTYDVDLAITMTDAPDPVRPGQNLTYTHQVRNDGVDTAHNVQVYGGSFIGCMTYVSSNAPAGWTCTYLGNNVACTTPTLAPGASATITMTGRVDCGSGGGDFSTSNSVIVSSNDHEVDSSDNTASTTTAIDAYESDVAVTITDTPDPVHSGENIVYTVTATNNGPEDAPNVNVVAGSFIGDLEFVSVNAPAGWTCSYIGNPVSCSTANLAVGATATITMTGHVLRSPQAADSSYTAPATINSPNKDANTANNNASTTTQFDSPQADLVVNATDSPDPVDPGANLTYTGALVNNGPDASPHPRLVIPLDGKLTFVSINAAGFTCTTPAVGANGILDCTSTGTLASGGSMPFTLVTKVASNLNTPGTINQGFVPSGDSNDTDPTNTVVVTNHTGTPAQPQADLAAGKSTVTTTTSHGANVTYTLVLTNNGPDASTSPSLTDVLPASLLFQSITEPAGFTCTKPAVGASGTITCSGATLAAGTSATFTLVAKVANTASGSIANTATVADSTQDPVANNESATATITMAQADLTISKTTTATTAAQGSNVTYTISMTNSGPNAAPNATMTDTLPATLLFQSITQPGGFTCATPAVNATGTITCTNASFAVGTATFTLVAKVANGATGNVSNSASAGSSASDPTPANSSSAPVVPLATSDLTLSKTTAATAATPGSNLTYTLTLHNNGPDAATNTVLTDTLPASLLFQSISAVAGFSCTTPAVGASGTITCTNASFASGATATFTLVVQVSPTATGTISNTASASSAIGDPTPATSSSAPVPVTGTADLSVTKTTAATAVTPGSNITYTVTMTNAGPSAATNAVMSDVLPSSLRFQSITPASGFSCTAPAVGASGTITCTKASFAVGSGVFTIVAQVAANATGTVANTATVSSASADPDSGDTSAAATTPVTPSADLSIAKTTGATTAVPGNNITYTIVLMNSGPSAAANAVVTDVLPASLRFQSITPASGFTCTTPAVGASGTITCTNASFAVGNATFTVVAQVAPGATGSIGNTASVASATGDPDAGDTSSSTSTPVGAAESAVPVPTLSEWALIACAALLGIAAMLKMR